MLLQMQLLEKDVNFFIQNSDITAAIIAVCGVIIGGILTFVSQSILGNISRKGENKKQLVSKKLEIYPKALDYIMFFANYQQNCKNNNDSEYKNKKEDEEKIKYKEFYFIFCLIAPGNVVKKFDLLRERIQKVDVLPEEVYAELQEILEEDLKNNR